MTAAASIDPRIADRVTPQLVDAFQRDGAVCIRQLLSYDEVRLLREGIDTNLGDDIRHAPRRWVTSPALPGLADALPAGAPMGHPLFPLLWEAS